MPEVFDSVLDKLEGKPSAVPEDDSAIFGDILDSIEPFHEPTPTGNVGSMREAVPLTPDQPMGYGDRWGPWLDAANKATLGMGITAQAAGEAARRGYEQYQAGATFPEVAHSFLPDVREAKQYLGAESEAWQKQHPGQALANSVIAPLPAVIYSQGRLAGLATRGLEGIAPKSAEVLNKIFTGQAGKGILARTGSRAAQGAMQGGSASLLESGLTPNSAYEDMMSGIAIGAAANPILGSILPPIGRFLNAEVTPGVARAAQYLRDRGVEVKAGQMFRDPELRKEAIGRGAGGDTKQLDQLTNALAETFGVHDVEHITADVADRAFDRLGVAFQNAADNIGYVGDRQLMLDLATIRNELAQEMDPSQPNFNKITHFLNLIEDDVSSGQLDGGKFRLYTRTNGPLFRQLGMSFNQGPGQGSADLKHYGSQIVTALHDAVARNADPADVAYLNHVKELWKNLATLSPAIAKAQPSGTIAPVDIANLKGGSEAANMGRAARLLKDVKPTHQGGAASTEPSLLRKLVDKAGQIASGATSGGLVGGAAVLLPQALGPGGTALVAGGALAGALGRAAADAYTNRLLKSGYMANRAIATGNRLGTPPGAAPPPMPAMPLDLMAVRALGAARVPAIVGLVNEGQK